MGKREEIDLTETWDAAEALGVPVSLAEHRERPWSPSPLLHS